MSALQKCQRADARRLTFPTTAPPLFNCQQACGGQPRGLFDQRPQFSRRCHHPRFAPRRPISLPRSEGIKVTECNHVRYQPMSRTARDEIERRRRVFCVSLIEL